MFRQHLKFVGSVYAIDTYGDVWSQRVVQTTAPGLGECWADWRMTRVPLPPGVEEGYFVAVHRTKAGHWYAVNLSARMPPFTEHQIKHAEAQARRWMRLFKEDSYALPQQAQ